MTDKRIIPDRHAEMGPLHEGGEAHGWLVEDGTKINVGESILEVETDKIAGAVEATDARRAAPPRRRGRHGLSGQGADRRHRRSRPCPTARSTTMSPPM